MARKGQTITNSAGERYHFWETASSTNGNLCKFEMWLPPQKAGPPPHLHPFQDEAFHIISGILTLKMNGKVQIARGGDTLFIPKGTVHTLWNSGDGECHATCEVTPALEWEYFLEDFANLSANGQPSLLQLALVIQAHKTTVAAPAPMNLFFGFLAWLGKAIGTKVPRSSRELSV